jgi:hypothetical protein
MVRTSLQNETSGATFGSVLVGQHDGQHAPGNRRITGVGRMAGKGEIVVVDLEHHSLVCNAKQGAVVFTVWVVRRLESSERLHRPDHLDHAELMYPPRDDNVAALPLGTQFVIQRANALCFRIICCIPGELEK